MLSNFNRNLTCAINVMQTKQSTRPAEAITINRSETIAKCSTFCHQPVRSACILRVKIDINTPSYLC